MNQGADAVADIKSRLNIEDVVSEYVQLKRSGRNFKGLSPFTNEKSPSFMVSPEKQIWHDFSSGQGGDMFSFIQAVEGVDFKGSLDILARKSGIDLSEYRQASSVSSKIQKQSKDRLFQAVEEAVNFYQRELMKKTDALKYLRETRAFSKQIIINFRFGFSPEKGDALTNHLLSKEFTFAELQKVGLSGERNGRRYDMFRGRIMVPLLDLQGRPVGFTARLLHKNDDAPKYINTPATSLYDKGRQLFGFSQAKEAMRKQGFVLVVEGNLDVVASHQAGVINVVASAGTALTTEQLQSLLRFTGDIRLAFDSDRAGQTAVERIVPVAQSLGVELSIINLPDGQDPDDLIRQDVKKWQKIIEQKHYMVDWLIDRTAEQMDMSSATGKRQFTTQVLELISKLKDPVEQEHYIQKVAEKTHVSVETIKAKMQSRPAVKRRLKRVKQPEQNDERAEQENRIREQHFLSIASHKPTIAQMLDRAPLDIFSDKAQPTVSQLQEHGQQITTRGEYDTMLTLLFEEFYQNADDNELEYQAKQLLSRLVKTYANSKKQSLIAELDAADEAKQTILLTAIKQLDELIKQFASRS